MSAMPQIIDDAEVANELAWAYAHGCVEFPGVYEINGDVFVVKWNQSKTRLYAKQWIRTASGAHLDYISGAIYRLHPCNRINYERALELSVEFSACCVCGKTLTDPKSVKRGIGPVCKRLLIVVSPGQERRVAGKHAA